MQILGGVVLVNGNATKLIAIFAIGGAVFWGMKDSEIYLDSFGLGPANTVYDFQTASRSAQKHFLIHKCRNGVCQSYKDEACGYEVDIDASGFDDCVMSDLDRSPAWEKLGNLLKICGKKFQRFTGAYGDPVSCRELSR